MSDSGIQGKKATQRESFVGRSLQSGEYHIEAILGNGGMGQVFLASHATLDVPVALKQVRADQPLPQSVIAELDRVLHNADKDASLDSPKDVWVEDDFPLSGGANTDRFLREALLLLRLHHPAIPELYDYFFEDGYWYLVMEYIQGTTLHAYIREHAPLPPLEALNYAIQLCDVLDYLHKQSPPVIFRDLKPSNVILTHDGRLMLVDFGIARYFKEGQINDTTDFGSPGYASPEQYQGTEQTDGRSDLFSLGIILHEMISGQRPPRVGGKLELLHQMNPALSPALSGLVAVATRLEPIYRFQSAHAFYQALERTYLIEEHRAYQHYMSLRESPEGSQAASSLTSTRSDSSEAHGGLRLNGPSSPGERTQRIHARESQNSEQRREQLEKEALDIQLAAIDESLKHRTLKQRPILLSPLPVLPTPIPTVADQEAMPLTPRSASMTHRIVFGSFCFALLLFLVMTSLLTYNHFFYHLDRPSQGLNLQGHAAPTPSAAVSSSWQVLPSLPSAEADNTAIDVQLQGRAYIYMSGGYRGLENSPHYDRSLYRYDIAAAHWETIISSHFPGMVNNAVASDEHNHLFFTAGYSSDTYALSSLLYMYDPAEGTLKKITPPTQTPIGFGAAILADQQGHLYISQGFMKPGDAHVLAGTGWYRYDISTGEWNMLTPLPVGLGYTVLAPDGNGGILMLGGSRDAGEHLSTNQIYRYDILQNTWTLQPATLPIPLSGAASCLDGHGHIVIIGGYDAVHNTSLSQTWLIDLHTLRWQQLAPLPNGGSLLGSAASDGAGHIFLVRGANNPSRPTADFWELTIKE